MRIYVKNKNFIPLDFINKINSKANRNNNRLLTILLIINIFIIPTSVSKIKNNIINNKVIPVVNINNDDIDINKEKIKKALNIINNNISSMKIQNNHGLIEVKSIEEIYNMEKEEIIKINILNFNNETNFTAEVELWLKRVFCIY